MPFHHAAIPAGADVRIEAKIRSDMPFPTPRCVISSPIHISRVAPAVRVTTIRITLPAVKLIRLPEVVTPSAFSWNA